MKTKLLSILLLILGINNINAQCSDYLNIPDVNFKAYLVNNSDINQDRDAEISYKEATLFTGIINVANATITDLTGLKYFINITELYCESNKLTSLNVSKNVALTTLVCSANKIKSLDVSKNINLITLDCSYNNLESLNIANGNYNNLSVSTSSFKNNANSCIQVDDKDYADKNWSGLKDDPVVYSEDCGFVCLLEIPDVNFKNYLISNPNINKGYDDSLITCEEAEAYTGTIDVTNLGITDLTGIEAFTNITSLYCGENEIEEIDLTYNLDLLELKCNDNKISCLNISKNLALKDLRCHNNELTILPISNNVSLEYLKCNANELTNLDISKNTALENLYCGANKITTLNTSKNTSLTALFCQNNDLLISLNVANGNNTNLSSCLFNNNKNLTCIQVDNKEYFEKIWYNKKDDTTVYSENCEVSLSTDSTHLNSFNIYPNPVADILKIKSEEAILNVEVFSLAGKLFLNSTGKTVNVSNLKYGVYILKIKTEGGQEIIKK